MAHDPYIEPDPLDRLRRFDDLPEQAGDKPELDDDEALEAARRDRRRRITLGVGIFVGGCLAIACCVGLYALSQSGFGGGPATPPTATIANVATFTPAPASQTPAEVVSVPEDLTATIVANLPPARYTTLTELVGEVSVRAGLDSDWTPAADMVIFPGTTVLTGQNSRAKITFAEGAIVRLSSQTQFTLIEASGTDLDPITLLQLDFGKIWSIVWTPLNAGSFEVLLPVGSASVRGSFMSAEYNSTTDGIVVSCLEGQCHYENANGAADIVTGQQAVTIKGSAPVIQRISIYQLTDWNPGNVPEVLVLTPTPTNTAPPTDTATATATRTTTPTRTPRPSATLRPSATPVPSRTPTNTRTPRATTAVPASATPSATPSPTVTVGPTATAGAPTKLAFTLVPAVAQIGVTFKVEVAVQDANGTTVPNATSPVTIAIGTNGGGGTLSGGATVTPVNGIATFNVSIDKAGSYTLVASASNLASATSNAFNVSGSVPLLFVISGLPADVSFGTDVIITVTAIEAGGAVSTGYVGIIVFDSSDPQASLPPDYTFTPADNGSHTFTIVFNTLGAQTLRVFDLNSPSVAGFAGTNVK